MTDDPMTLIERLQNPAWCHSDVPFDSPQLDKEQAVNDMRAAAERIELLETSEDNRILKLKMTLRDAERFMSYFAGETNHFVGSGTPKTMLAEIRAILGDGASLLNPSAPDASTPAQRPRE